MKFSVLIYKPHLKAFVSVDGVHLKPMPDQLPLSLSV